VIQSFVDAFIAAQPKLRERFSEAHPEDYTAIVKAVVETVADDDAYDSPDPERIHVIDDGDYQGTLLFVIAARGYQPDNYWYVKVGYGSCSGCDTLEAIRSYSGEKPTAEQADDYLALALHVVQGLKAMNGESA
jgi:hypothetical protein